MRTGPVRDEQIRQALVQVEGERDDAVAYLSTIKELLAVLARGHGLKACAQGIAEVLVRELAVESCAVTLEEEGGTLALLGFATQAQRLGGAGGGPGEAAWLDLARLVGPRPEPSCFRRAPDGGFAAVQEAELAGEGFLVLPFGGIAGALVLHWVVAPAQRFGRGQALALIAECVGQAMALVRLRESTERVCVALEGELGSARKAASAQEATLRARERNIEALMAELVRANKAKREFLGTVSHELRTPLNGILGYASLLRDGMVGAISAEQESALDRVIGCSRNLNELIGDMLFYVQVEADRVLVRRERVDTREVIDVAVSAVRGRQAGERLALHVEVAPEAATLWVDESLLRRVLFHLVGNAFKFTAEGEVHVVVRPDVEPGGAVLVVRDTGAGIPPERLDELFEPFTQADSSTTRRHEGVGMGLALVQRCARLLGGEVAVESRPGAGSEFRVRLPGALASAAAAAPAQPEDAAP
ncbi:MAG TPA: HAMP domain-containing sensor histidine kinase [Candidatus Binatia bacterium]|nr:HAMP domain-containing sensor histidine kinase [Candidatus Binatia bacterium]